MGVVIGLLAGYVRRRLANRIAEKHPSNWERIKQTIFGLGIFTFSGLGIYCFFAIQQPTFGAMYVLMSLLNVICLFRSLGRGSYDENGMPRRHQRKPRRVTPIVDVPVPRRTVDHGADLPAPELHS